MQRTGNHLLATLCIAFLLFIATTCTAFANSYQECYIERYAEGDYMMKIPTGTYSVPTRMNTTVSELADATWDVPIVLRGTDPIGCKDIPYGNASVHFLNAAGSDDISGYTTENGSVLLKTTVPGVAYTLELLCISCPIALNLKLPVSGEDTFVLDDADWEGTDSKWKLRFRFFTTPEFKPTNGISSGTLKPGRMASWYIGINDQPWVHFDVDADTFKFTVEQPTCTTIALDSVNPNVSGTEIKLGDYYISQVKQNITRKVPFSIRGDYCYANKITVKLDAANNAPDRKLIGKSSGSATGVGVKVYATVNNSEIQLNADGSNSAIFNYADWSHNLLFFPFSAQLVKDGGNGTITPGNFRGNATFSFSYE
ncbi:fimbrial protein [Escherichia coli]|nr:fimbrial protein [Escherichia coli]